MTQRKPPRMSFETWIDHLIGRAQREGQFEELEGAGKPLEDLDGVRDPLWWAKGLVRREGLDLVPPAIEVRRKVEKLRERMPEISREEDLRAALEVLNAEIRHLNKFAAKGPPTSQAPLDVEREVERWRTLRRSEPEPNESQ